MAGPIPPPYPPPDAARTTAAQLCRWALMSIGRLGATQPLDADDLQISFEMLNGMVDAWRLNALLVNHVTSHSVALVAGQDQYTVGPGGDFDIAFPPQIDYGTLLLDGTILRPLGTPREFRNYPAGVARGTLTTDFPDRFFYAPTYLAEYGPIPAGCGAVVVYPTPDNSRHQLTIWYPFMLSTFVEPLAEYYLRPGMVRALRTNLAMEIAPLFNAQPSDVLRKQAKAAYDWLQMIGGTPHELSVDRALMWRRSPYNLFADDWNTY